MKRLCSPVVVLFLILSGCISAPDNIRDVRELRQDHASYFTGITKSEDPLPAAVQTRMDEDYNTIYFPSGTKTVHFMPCRTKSIMISKNTASNPVTGKIKSFIHHPG